MNLALHMARTGRSEMIEVVGAERCNFCFAVMELSTNCDDTNEMAKELGPKDKTESKAWGGE